MCLSNFKVMRSYKLPISRLRDFTRSYIETFYQILKRCPSHDFDSIPIRFRLLTGDWFPLKSANSASTPAHGTRRKNAMHQISHRNFLVVGSFRHGTHARRGRFRMPKWTVARPVNKVNFINHATKLSQNYYTTGFWYFSGNEHPYSMIFKSIFHEKLLRSPAFGVVTAWCHLPRSH